MIATVLSDISTVLIALSALIAATGAVIASRRGRRIEAKVGAVSVVVDGIDHAVNRQPKHAPTIPERLDDISVRLERVADDVVDLHSRLDVLEHPKAP